MTTANSRESSALHPYQAQWTKLIAKAWTDPSFQAQFFDDPVPILLAYGIETVQGHSVAGLAANIRVVEQAPAWKQKPTLIDGVLTIPFPIRQKP
jgi:hypothetical protein